MKTKIFIIAGTMVVLSTIFLGACMPKVVSKAIIGVPIEKAKVDLIVKNQTTEAEIQEMFGSPMNKVLVGEQEMWMYMYQDIDAQRKATSLKGGETTSTGTYQKLDVYIKDGVVTNYLYNDAPMPAMQGTGEKQF